MEDSLFKFGAPSRRRFEQLRTTADSKGERVAIILRAAAPLSAEQADELERDGAVLRTRAGMIVTLDVPLSGVERVLEHEFVVAAELATPLYPDRDRKP